MNARELFKEDYDEVKKIIQLFSGKVTCVWNDSKTLFTSLDKSKKGWYTHERKDKDHGQTS